MKQLFTFLFIALATQAFSQVNNWTATDCNSNSKTIHDVLGSGKVLLVASKGFDCSICQSRANGMQTFAAQNTGGIEVWGAMTFKYSGATPTCQDVSSWVSNYGWNDIFTFIDDTQHWVKTGIPRYYVYDPADSTVAYEGFNESTAFQTAQGLVSSVNINEPREPNFSIANYEGYIEIQNWPYNLLDIQLVNITGKTVKELVLRDQVKVVSTEELKPGIYLLSLANGKGYRTVRKIYVN